jgi:hypothetical protein
LLPAPPRRPKIFGMRDLHGGMYRRLAPRIGVEVFCSELVDGTARPGLVLDLAPTGVRIERPYQGGRLPRELALELEVPEIDEVIWAKAAVCFDQIRPAPAGTHGGRFGFLRTTGLRIVAAAARDLRMLRDCVYDLRARDRAREIDDDQLLVASCYARG